VWCCAKAVRALLDDGCPPAEIAVVARALDPYLAPLHELFAEHQIPLERHRRACPGHPLAQTVLLLFRAALTTIPRRGPRRRLPPSSARRRAPPLAVARALRIGHGADWERLGRYARAGYTIVAGREDEDDRRELHVRAEEVRGLGWAVRRLRGIAWPDRAGWRAHAAAHAGALRRHFRRDGLLDEETRVLEALHAVLESLARLDALGESVPRRTFVEAFERECRRRRLETTAGQGVAVLDAMTARGLPFRHVFLLGLNARTFPRFIVEEPFVSDTVRREVIRVLGHHLPVRADGYDEERLLFHLVRSAATDGLVCLYQRADAQGRLRDPSPFLRPLLTADRPADRVPRSAGEKRKRPGVRTPRELLLAAADPARALAALGYDAEAYARAERVLRALDGSPAVSAFEGRVGRLEWVGARLSATRLETFAACPFRYFADEVLRLFPYEEHTAGDDLTPLEIGSLMHAVLEALYRDLAARGFDTSDLAAEVERAAGGAVAAFERRAGVVASGLLAARVAHIRRAVEAYARWDLAHLDGWEPVAFEQRASAELAGLGVSGTIDRVDRHRTRGVLRVIDYKRRWREDWRTRLATQAKRGKKLQGPFYLELAAGLGRGEVEEAAFQFVENYADEDPAIGLAHLVSSLTAEAWRACRADVEQAIGTFAGMIREGWFFIRPDDDGRGGHCRYCDFKSICRKNYGRLGRKPEAAPEAAAYWDVVGR
jgi:ATP-dependent helicase/nuclease subunit B